jgi:hypothetical protein
MQPLKGEEPNTKTAVKGHKMPVTRIYVFVLTSLLSVNLAEAKESHTSMGIGVYSCAQFAKDYQRDPTLRGNFYFFWAQGWMSGFNASKVVKEMRDLNSMEVGEQERFIRNYCNDHPLKDYKDAVLSLYLELKYFDTEVRE